MLSNKIIKTPTTARYQTYLYPRCVLYRLYTSVRHGQNTPGPLRRWPSYFVLVLLLRGAARSIWTVANFRNGILSRVEWSAESPMIAFFLSSFLPPFVHSAADVESIVVRSPPLAAAAKSHSRSPHSPRSWPPRSTPSVRPGGLFLKFDTLNLETSCNVWPTWVILDSWFFDFWGMGCSMLSLKLFSTPLLLFPTKPMLATLQSGQ